MNGTNAEPPRTARSDDGGRELAGVPEAERWRRIVDLAAAHGADAEDGEEDDARS